MKFNQTIFVSVFAALLAAILIGFYLFSASPKITPENGTKTAYPVKGELEKCNRLAVQYGWTKERKNACYDFMKNWCPTLVENYSLRERAQVAERDIGMRVPVLDQALDPVYPVNCYEQWWLTEADLFDAEVKPFSKFEGFKEFSRKYFAHTDSDGQLRLPKLYDVEKKYSNGDQIKLRRILQTAYRYANINRAIRDGYTMQPSFNQSMGIHVSNLSLFDETIDLDRPEFFTYIKSRQNNAYVLAQVGFILVKNNNFRKFHFPLFDTHEAHGHNYFLVCNYVNGRNWTSQITISDDVPVPENKQIHLFMEQVGYEVPVPLTDALSYYKEIQEKKELSPYKVDCHDSVWMIHVAINLYNENGLFSDLFPLIDTMSQTGELYSFFGRKFTLKDYEHPAS